MRRIRDCPFADDVLYDTEKGVWVRQEGALAAVGIDAVSAWLSGAFTSVSFKEEGTVVERGAGLGSTESARHFDIVRSPLTCTIVESNELLKERPKLLNQDPYGEGWFVKVRPTKFREESGELGNIEVAREAIARRVAEMNVRCFAAFPDFELYEIGSECSAVLPKLDDLLGRSPAGTVVHLVSDDMAADVELVAWSERTGHEVLETRKGGSLTHFIIIGRTS